jgi:hypothetical protein
MPVIEIISNNVPANTVNLDVAQGARASQISPLVKGASVALFAVASAVGLSHALWVGDRNPLEQSPVGLSATPNEILVNSNGVISGVLGVRNELIRLYVTETAGAATNDYRARVIVSEFR